MTEIEVMPAGNRLVLAAVAFEVLLLAAFVGIPPLADLLGGSWPTPGGWLAASACPVALVAVDGLAKTLRGRTRPSGPSAPEVGPRVPARTPPQAARLTPTDASGGVG